MRPPTPANAFGISISEIMPFYFLATSARLEITSHFEFG